MINPDDPAPVAIPGSRIAPVASSGARTWTLALVAGLLAGVIAWAIGEATLVPEASYENKKANVHVALSVSGIRNGTISFGALGAATGLAPGTGRRTDRAFRSAYDRGRGDRPAHGRGCWRGSVAVNPPRLLRPFHHRRVDLFPDGPLRNLGGRGSVAGLAFGIGLGGWRSALARSWEEPAPPCSPRLSTNSRVAFCFRGVDGPTHLEDFRKPAAGAAARHGTDRRRCGPLHVNRPAAKKLAPRPTIRRESHLCQARSRSRRRLRTAAIGAILVAATACGIGLWSTRRYATTDRDSPALVPTARKNGPAADLARETLAVRKDDRDALRLLARASARLGREDAAMAIYQRWFNQTGLETEDLLLVGMIQQRQGRTDTTARACNKVRINQRDVPPFTRGARPGLYERSSLGCGHPGGRGAGPSAWMGERPER